MGREQLRAGAGAAALRDADEQGGGVLLPPAVQPKTQLEAAGCHTSFVKGTSGEDSRRLAPCRHCLPLHPCPWCSLPCLRGDKRAFFDRSTQKKNQRESVIPKLSCLPNGLLPSQLPIKWAYQWVTSGCSSVTIGFPNEQLNMGYQWLPNG